MKREFLKNLGLEDETIDKILDEASKDIGKEKQKREQAEADLKTAKEQLANRDKDLEELKKSAGDVKAVQDKLDELQSKYDTETADYKKQLEERDYAEAMSSAIAGAGIKFSSKAAEKAFRTELKAKGLTVKDGTLEGFAEYLKGQKEADPEAFAPEKPGPIIHQVGAGGNPGNLSAGAKAAQKFNAQYAPTKKE